MNERKMLDGCSDGNCVIVKPVGMHTNGGCKCLRYPENVHKFRDELAALKDERDRCRAALERVVQRGLNYCTQSTLDICKDALHGTEITSCAHEWEPTPGSLRGLRCGKCGSSRSS